jgi:alpha-glucosidase
LGNTNVVHEACGYNDYNSNVKTANFDYELCIRWLQVVAVNPLARFNFLEAIANQRSDIKLIFQKVFKLRLEMSSYLMSYMVKHALGGGSFIRPLFVDFQSFVNINEVMKSTAQFMMGTNMMAAPVIKSGDIVKQVFFPKDIFYDFMTGRLMNPKGEGFQKVDAALNYIPLFLRAGSIVQVQSVPDKVNDVVEMRKQPFHLKIGLDVNLRSYGRILIEDGYSKRLILIF